MSSIKKGWKVLLLTAMMLAALCGMTASVQASSGDNSLSTLGILTEGAEVSPEFYYSTIEYNVTVPAGTTKLELDPVPSNSNASIVDITGTELVDGETTVEILVEAENGSRYTYYLYVEEDASTAAPAVAETEPQTEKQTEPETEPETEDPRYVRVDRNSLQEAENTISALKTETVNYRDRLGILMKILYGLIAFCVLLLFVVINLMLKKKDLKAELQNYRGYDYPQEKKAGKSAGASYPDQYGYDNSGYAATGYQNQSYDSQGYANQGYAEPAYDDADYAQENQYPEQMTGYEKRKDDPNTVPKPAKAKKKAKPMPKYQKPEKQAEYQPNADKASENVEINMIDL